LKKFRKTEHFEKWEIPEKERLSLTSSQTAFLQARGLTREFRGFYAVKDLDLDIRAGQVHALIGPNGAGKTTVFNLLTRVLDCTEGQIRFDGEDITRMATHRVARLGLVRSFQISSVFPALSVLENIRVALQRPNGLGMTWWRSRSALDRLDERAHALLLDVQLGDFGLSRAGDLPYGRKRALEIATTLALEPRMLLLDEPMAGMGTEDVVHVTELVRRVARSRTVLMVEHNLKAVAELSDRITVLARGEKLAEGTYDEIRADAEVRRAYLGGTAHA